MACERPNAPTQATDAPGSDSSAPCPPTRSNSSTPSSTGSSRCSPRTATSPPARSAPHVFPAYVASVPFRERLELLGDQAGRVALTRRPPLPHREDRLPAVQPLEAQRRADDLLAVAGLRVHMAEPWERRARDHAVAQVVGRTSLVERLGGVVLVTGPTDKVGARCVDEILLRAHARGLHHVVTFAGPRERAAGIQDEPRPLESQDPAQLGVEPEVVTDLHADRAEARREHRKPRPGPEDDPLGHP